MNNIFDEVDLTKENLMEAFDINVKDQMDITGDISLRVIKNRIDNPNSLEKSSALQTKILLDLISNAEDISKRNKYRKYLLVMTTIGISKFMEDLAIGIAKSL